MDGDMYDEFGNYIGPDIESEEDEEPEIEDEYERGAGDVVEFNQQNQMEDDDEPDPADMQVNHAEFTGVYLQVLRKSRGYLLCNTSCSPERTFDVLTNAGYNN